MIYGSVCSGIEAATVAWHPLGWRPAFFSEIDAFPRAVLAHHYPEVPLHGDFTTIRGDEYGRVDLLVGGTPCQDFSVAGKREGLGGERGNLTLEFARLAYRLGSDWLAWENVPGCFTLNAGRDFGAVVACFAGYPEGSVFEPPANGWGSFGVVPPAHPNAYGLAWRVLDAQFFGVAQRRRRVFVVGYLGDWRRAAAVLFERESLSGNPPPRREAGKGVASGAISGAVSRKWAKGTGGPAGDEAYNLTVAHALRADGFDASEDGTGRGTPLIPVTAPSLSPGTGGGSGHQYRQKGNEGMLVPVQCFDARQSDVIRHGDVCPTLQQPSPSGGGQQHAVLSGMAVRRLTPRECERLQGFPDDYTAVPYRGKPAADGPRYKALGNSMAVPVMRWIGERIDLVSQICADLEEVA